jgi:uncharacterized membrane protein
MVSLNKTANGLTLLMAAVLLLGIWFRLVNLDGKLYWHDEAYTSLRIAGYTHAEVYQQAFNGEPIDAGALQKYQHPNSEKGVLDTLRTLAIDDAQHPPLYYLLVRLWVQLWGSSPAAVRSLSVVAGLAVLPLVYWLCRELFVTPLIGWIAVALIAVSPFHVLYAQEAREYALWTALIVLSSGALLRALRLQTWQSWSIYSVTLLLGLYTYLFTGLVAIGHGVYVGLRERRINRVTLACLLSLLLAFAAFAPWLWLVIITWSQTGATWTAIPIPLLTLLKLWAMSLERAFVLTLGDFGFDTALVYISLPLLLALVGWALVALCCQTPFRVWGFVLALIGSTALPLALPDLLIGGQRSTSSRYLVPCYLGIQLAAGYWFASQLTSRAWFKQRLGAVILAIVLSSGVVSGVITAQAETTWNKVVSYNNLTIARILNQAEHPLLITSSFGINFGNILALSHVLEPSVKLQLVQGSNAPDFTNVPEVAPGFETVFLLNLSDPLRQAIEQQQNATAELVFQDFHLFLWQLRSSSASLPS